MGLKTRDADFLVSSAKIRQGRGRRENDLMKCLRRLVRSLRLNRKNEELLKLGTFLVFGRNLLGNRLLLLGEALDI
jgi:hypothetical protein